MALQIFYFENSLCVFSIIPNELEQEHKTEMQKVGSLNTYQSIGLIEENFLCISSAV